jgi:hypothetical protein
MASDRDTDRDYDHEFAEWYAQDARRLNEMGEAAKRLGVQVGTEVDPPALNPDGFLKEALGD